MQDELAAAANLSRNTAGALLKRMAGRGLGAASLGDGTAQGLRGAASGAGGEDGLQ